MKTLKVLLCAAAFALLAAAGVATVPSPTCFAQFTLSSNPQTLSVPFVFQNSPDLLVLDTRGTATPVTLTQNSDYSVSGGAGGTGSVTTIAGGAHGVLVGDVITISRGVPITQTVSFTNTGPLTAAMIGQALDKQTQVSQQINLNSLRSLQFQGDETLSGVLSKSARSSKYLAFDSNGAPAFLDGTGSFTGDASLSLVTATGTSTARDLAVRFAETFDVRDFGAKGDGLTNDTAAIQSAITAAPAGSAVFLPSGTYLAVGLTMKSGVWLISQGATIKCPANSGVGVIAISFAGVSNSGLLGTLYMDGNYANQTNHGNSGQIAVAMTNGSTDLYVQRVYATGWQEDGLYVGDNTTGPSRVRIDSFESIACGRNGASITAGQYISIGHLLTNGTLNSDGTGPAAGLDVEPNSASVTLNDVTIGDHVSVGNVGPNLQVACALTGGTTLSGQGRITIVHANYNNSSLNSGVVLQNFTGLSILSGYIAGNALSGVEIRANVQNLRIGCLVELNQRYGVFGSLSSQHVASGNWDFRGSTFRNNSQAGVGSYDGALFQSDSASYVLNGVNIDGVFADDTQGTHTQRYGVNANANTANVSGRLRATSNTSGPYNGGTGSEIITKRFRSAVSVTPANPIAAGTVNVQTVAMPAGTCGAGDDVEATPYDALESNLTWSARVSTTDTVELRIANPTGSGVATSAKIWSFVVTSHQ